MSSQKIRDIALDLFTQKGYEGASLADISELVGIKKSSIYNHYASKDDLFMSIFQMCYEAEIFQTKLFFDEIETKDIFSVLKDYLEYRTHSIEHIKNAKFLFRFMTFPPFHLTEDLKQLKLKYFNQRQVTIFDQLAKHPMLQDLEKQQIQEFVSVYHTLLKGCIVETFAGQPTNIDLHLRLVWHGFEASIPVK